MARLYDTLSHEAKVLLDDAMQPMDAAYDPITHLQIARHDGQVLHTVRSSAHYALGLLVRGSEGDLARACDVIGAVIDAQFDCPGEVFHGTYRRSKEEPQPPTGTLPWRDITRLDRYHTEVFTTRVLNEFHKQLAGDETTQSLAPQIEQMLRASTLNQYPIVWASYDPNWREFIASTFAVILTYFEADLPRALVARIDASARLALDGAISRSQTGFTPLNTNIEIMHVFIVDFFGTRLQDAAASQYALDYAEDFFRRYSEFHAVNEFNSPTYCGVDLSAIRFWQRYASHPRIRELGGLLETGLWEDIADFYNPAMKNLCGPFSRNYEMDMQEHTAMYALLYLGLGEANFPDHPLSTETDHDPLLVLSGVSIPEHVKPRLLHAPGERAVRRQFRELNERGDPRSNNALCTATAWITDELMLGALSGSENVSGQLHPATIYWRDAAGNVSSMRLRRATMDGSTGDIRTVLFDCTNDKNTLSIDVRSTANRDVKVFFEFEATDFADAVFAPDHWSVCGLDIAVETDAQGFSVEQHGKHIRVCYLALEAQPETTHMRFSLTCKLQK